MADLKSLRGLLRPDQIIGAKQQIDSADKLAIGKLLRRIEAARRFPDNTDPCVRHVQIMGETLGAGRPYPMLDEERGHCAISLLAVVAALYEARNAAAPASSHPPASRTGAPAGKDAPNDPPCTCGSTSPRAYDHRGTCPHSTPWNDRVKARLAASGVVYVCRDHDAACSEVPVGLRCENCPAGKEQV